MNLKSAIPSTQDVTDMSDAAVEERMNLLGVAHDALDSQQQRYVMLVCSGMSKYAAARAVGVPSMKAQRFVENENVCHAVHRYKAEQVKAVNFGISEAHSMYMHAWANSKDATEQVKVADSLVKLHGISKEKQNSGGIKNQVNIQINATKEQLQSMTDDQLLELAGKPLNALTPEAEETPDDDGTAR